MRAVGYPPARHRHPEVELAVALLMPTEMVGNRECRHPAARLERLAEIFLEAIARPVLAVFGDHVFEPGVATVATVAMIAVQADDRSGSFEQVLGLDEGDRG